VRRPTLTLVRLPYAFPVQVAVQIEMPFGLDGNDLPIGSFCLSMEADVLTLLDEFEGAAQHDATAAEK